MIVGIYSVEVLHTCPLQYRHAFFRHHVDRSGPSLSYLITDWTHPPPSCPRAVQIDCNGSLNCDLTVGNWVCMVLARIAPR